MEKLENCPLCKNVSRETYMQINDHSTSKEIFTVEKCSACGFLFTNPRPDENEIQKYYESSDYISHTDDKKGVINKVYHVVRNKAIKEKYTLVNSFGTTKKILDYGCGTGSFLEYCKEQKWDTTGAEPNKNAREILTQKGINALMPNEISSLEKGSFGVVTLWHVLEHVHRLDETVNTIKSLLVDDGVLIIAVPNHTSYDAQYYKEYWAAYDIPIHLYHFAPNDIKTYFSKNGFTLEKVLPMKFDSFYVSMLSEKYKNGGNLVNAFLIGLKSNLKAASGKNNTYSSQIYVLRKNKAI